MKLISPIVITGPLSGALPAFAQSTLAAEMTKNGGTTFASKTGGERKSKVSSEQRAYIGQPARSMYAELNRSIT